MSLARLFASTISNGGTRLLLAFPELKCEHGAVRERLLANGATEMTLSAWQDLVHQEILPDDDESQF